MLLPPLLLLSLLLLITQCEAKNFSYDGRSVLVDGERVLMLSGAVHYARVLPEDWSRVVGMGKEMGLNTIQTYVMWNFHEEEEGGWGWEGRRDLRKFLDIISQHNMYATVRIGPYICGEYYYGGIPVWMREKAKCYRCSDPGWETNMKNVLKTVVDHISDLFITQNGPVVMLQVENEYNGGDQAYLEWSVSTARGLTTEIPWNLCHDLTQCSEINRNPSGDYVPKVFCTINGFWMDEYTKDTHQPCPKWIEDNRKGNPSTPLVWTEDQGWFNQWKVANRVRVSSDQLYGITRWFAYGGSWHNFYMLTGGNNYGYQSGGMVTTAYAPDTPINWLLMKHEPRFTCYQKFFTTMSAITTSLLSHPIPDRTPLLPVNMGVTSSISMQTCTDTDPAHPGVLDASQHWVFNGTTITTNLVEGWCLEAWGHGGVALCNDTHSGQHFVMENTMLRTVEAVQGEVKCLDIIGNTTQFVPCPSSVKWEYDAEREGGFRPQQNKLNCLTAENPTTSGAEYHLYGDIAFLSNTGETVVEVVFDGTNFTLQNHSVTIARNLSGSSKGWVALYATSDCVDAPHAPASVAATTPTWKVFRETPGHGSITTTSPTPVEQLSVTGPLTDYLWYTLNTTGNISLEMIGGSIGYPHQSGGKTHVLSVAMGMSNTGVTPSQGKGVKKATVNGTMAYDGEWVMSAVLEGEKKDIYNKTSSGSVAWVQWSHTTHDPSPYTWYQANITAGVGQAYALELSSMWKGVAFVNGFNIGRYWLTPGECSGTCAPPVKNGHCYMHWDSCGKPTQTTYHIPSSLITTTSPNLVTLFEETTGPSPIDPSKVQLVTYS